jgi:hypothetical protein
MSLISNARGTSTLGHVYINGRRVLRSDLPPTHPSFSALVTRLPTFNREDKEGLAAAIQMTDRQTPREIHNLRSLNNTCRLYGNDPTAHQHVKASIWRHSTMVTTIDLRDDPLFPDGEARVRGAIFRDAETALNTCRIRLTIWVEISGNSERSVEFLEEIIDMCPQLQRLDVDITSESSLDLSLAVQREVRLRLASRVNARGITGEIEATIVDRE